MTEQLEWLQKRGNIKMLINSYFKNIKMSKRFDKNVLNISNNIISSRKTTSFERRSNFNSGQAGY